MIKSISFFSFRRKITIQGTRTTKDKICLPRYKTNELKQYCVMNFMTRGAGENEFWHFLAAPVLKPRKWLKSLFVAIG